MIKLVVDELNLNIISAYVPHVGLDEEVKNSLEEFGRDSKRYTKPQEDFHWWRFYGHIEATSSRFDDAHGGFDFRENNGGGASLQDFTKAFELVIASLCFLKRENH